MQEHSKVREIVVGIVSTAVGAAIGAVITAVITNNIMVTDYISLNSLDNLVNTYFVQTGLVDKSVIGLEADEQIASIARAMTDQNMDASESGDVLAYVTEQLGIDVESDSLKDSLTAISEAVSALQNERDSLQEEGDSLNEQLESVSAENEELRNRSTADILQTGLIIDGENITDALSSGVALIDGNAYYSEFMLETYLLDADLRYDSAGNNIVYGNEKPEKVRFAPGMIVNDNNLLYNATFTMATDEYSNGIRGNSYYSDSYMQIRLKEQYSKCTFTVGHIDQASMNDGTIVFYARDEYGEFTVELKTIHLSGSMNPESYEIPLNYASDVKVVLNFGNHYGIINFYFYS